MNWLDFQVLAIANQIGCLRFSFLFYYLFLPQPQSNNYPARAGGYVIGAGVHIYIYMCVCVFVDKKKLNRTLAIDSPFQTFAVGLLTKFID